MGAKHCSVFPCGDLVRRGKFPYLFAARDIIYTNYTCRANCKYHLLASQLPPRRYAPNRTNPNYFVSREWFGFVFYINIASNCT